MNGLRRVLLIAVAAVFFMSFAVSAAAEDDTSDSSATVKLTAAASEEVAEEIAELTNAEAIVEMTTETTLAGQFAFSREMDLPGRVHSSVSILMLTVPTGRSVST